MKLPRLRPGFLQGVRWRQRATWGMSIGFLTALATVWILSHNPLGLTLEYDTLDFWFMVRDPQPVRDVAILAIDEATIRQWDGRTLDPHAIGVLLPELRRHGVRAVVLALPELDGDSVRGAAALAAGIAACRIAHLPLTLPPHFAGVPNGPSRAPPNIKRFAIALPVYGGSATSAAADAANPSLFDRALLAPPSNLLAGAAGAGHISFILDRAGRARSMALALRHGDNWYPALALSAALQATGSHRLSAMPLQADGEYAEPSDSRFFQVGRHAIAVRDGAMLLNYPYAAITPDNPQPPPAFTTLSVAAVLREPNLLSQLAGKVVVLGPTAPHQVAELTTPTGQRISETELDAVALDNLITGRALDPAPATWTWLLTILLCVIVGGFVSARQPLWSGIATFITLGSVAMLSFGLFEQDIWLDVSVPWCGVCLTFLIGVIGRARLEASEATRVGSTIDALTQVSELIAAQTHPGQLLQRVLHWAVAIMQANAASALLLDESGENLHFAAATGPISQDVMPFTLKLGEGIAGWVAQHGEPAIVNDVRRDERFSFNIDSQTGFSTQSVLCVPLRVRNKMLGVIEVINRCDGTPFIQADAELLSAVANQAAVVLDNARLYEILSQRVVDSESELAVTNQRLETEKNLFQTVLQSMTDGVIVTDRSGAIAMVNPAAAALLPELHGELEGQSIAEVLPDLAVSSADFLPHTLCENGWGSPLAQLLRGDPDSPRIIEAHAAPLQSLDGGQAGFVTVFADVTEQRNMEQAKSDFVSFVAHEMRSPLTSISGFSSMLQRSEGNIESSLPVTSRARFLGIIHDESERLTRLINNLLDVARIEAGRVIELNREPFDLAAVAMGAVESQRTYSRRHRVVCNIPRDLPPVLADRDKVTQIFINLLTNALKYSPGGTVTIEGHQVDGRIQVSVRDEGPGIAPEQRVRLFQRFGRTPPRAGDVNGPGERAKPTGTGLGLFLTKHLVETHGGHIWVESEPGRGAAFTFTLPLAGEAEIAESPLVAADSEMAPNMEAATVNGKISHV